MSVLRVGIFLACVALYHYTVEGSRSTKYPDETVTSAFFKGLPISALLLLVSCVDPQDTEHRYLKKNILLGLMFSLGGDIALVWRLSLFIPGLLSFAIAHLFYTRAFRFKPFGGEAAMLCLISSMVVYILFYPSIVEPELKVMCFFYISLIFTMWWRSIVRWQDAPNIGTLCACLGAFVFLVSDCFLGLDKWVIEVPYASEVIMCSYYTAQLGISLSVVLYQSSSSHKHLEQKQD